MHVGCRILRLGLSRQEGGRAVRNELKILKLSHVQLKDSQKVLQLLRYEGHQQAVDLGKGL